MDTQIPLLTPIRPGTTAGGGAGVSDAERRSLRDVAQEFESMLLLQMIKQMRQTFLDEESDQQGLGGQTMTETIDVELARTLARQGGLGLADSIEQGLARATGADQRPRSPVDGSTRSVAGPTRWGTAATPETGRAAADTGLAPSGGTSDVSPNAPSREAPASPGAERAQGLEVALPLADRVSSAYGWRSDPFRGLKRFHAGIDIAAAYGKAVPVAAPGRVISAGEQGGYGLSVVVDHGAGVQTRYAHLSDVAVGVGQELAQSDVVGRVGQSGRATGPHLHFEVALNGRKVDPAVVATRVPGGLKSPGGNVDSSLEGVPAGQPAVE